MTVNELINKLYELTEPNSETYIPELDLRIGNATRGTNRGRYGVRTRSLKPIVQLDDLAFKDATENMLAHELQHHVDHEKHYAEGYNKMDDYYTPPASGRDKIREDAILKAMYPEADKWSNDDDVQNARYRYQPQERRAQVRSIIMRFKQEYDKVKPDISFKEYVEDNIREGKWPNVAATNYLNRLQERNKGDYKKALKELYKFIDDDVGKRIGVEDLPSDALLKAVHYKPRLIVKRMECYG